MAGEKFVIKFGVAMEASWGIRCFKKFLVTRFTRDLVAKCTHNCSVGGDVGYTNGAFGCFGCYLGLWGGLGLSSCDGLGLGFSSYDGLSLGCRH